ncbi:MAG: MerR family transcriptional regulator [Bacteroidota bacterium]
MKSEHYDNPLFSIGTAARILDVSVQTLRLYESEGLLVIHKTKGNQRLYSQADIDRIACIRTAINEEKISIGGMKRIHGMIPCWDIIKCSHDERSHCPVFQNHTGGCWTMEHTKSVCAKKECRLCEVYKLSSSCGEIKELIFRSSLPLQTESQETPL